MAFLIKTTGGFETVAPKDGKRFSLEEMQAFVGGYIEHVDIGGLDMWLNEEGKLIPLPPNETATQLFRLYHQTADWIAGDVLLADRRETEDDAEEDSE